MAGMSAVKYGLCVALQNKFLNNCVFHVNNILKLIVCDNMYS